MLILSIVFFLFSLSPSLPSFLPLCPYGGRETLQNNWRYFKVCYDTIWLREPIKKTQTKKTNSHLQENLFS